MDESIITFLDIFIVLDIALIALNIWGIVKDMGESHADDIWSSDDWGGEMVKCCKKGCEYYDGHGCESSPLRGCVWRFCNCKTLDEMIELLRKRIAGASHGEIVDTVKELSEALEEKKRSEWR